MWPFRNSQPDHDHHDDIVIVNVSQILYSYTPEFTHTILVCIYICIGTQSDEL